MAKDVFGYNKEITTGLSSASAVTVAIANKTLSLAQSVGITYQRQVQPAYEIGSETVYMSSGRSSGTCNFDHLVGQQKFLEPFRDSASCKGVTINVSSGVSECGTAAGTITMQNCVLQQVGVNITADQITIHETANFNIGSLST